MSLVLSWSFTFSGELVFLLMFQIVSPIIVIANVVRSPAVVCCSMMWSLCNDSMCFRFLIRSESTCSRSGLSRIVVTLKSTPMVGMILTSWRCVVLSSSYLAPFMIREQLGYFTNIVHVTIRVLMLQFELSSAGWIAFFITSVWLSMILMSMMSR